MSKSLAIHEALRPPRSLIRDSPSWLSNNTDPTPPFGPVRRGSLSVPFLPPLASPHVEATAFSSPPPSTKPLIDCDTQFQTSREPGRPLINIFHDRPLPSDKCTSWEKEQINLSAWVAGSNLGKRWLNSVRKKRMGPVARAPPWSYFSCRDREWAESSFLESLGALCH